MNRIMLEKPGMFSVQAAADGRRFEFDINNEVILSRKLPVKLVFAGDSITHFWSLDAWFRPEGGMIVNRGISGDATEFLLRRFPADVIQLKPEAVVIHIGVNNTWALEDFPWARKSPDVTPEGIIRQIAGDITAMAGLAGKNGIRAVLCSILPTDMRWSANNRERNNIIFESNRRIQEFACSNDAVYVDYHGEFCSEDGRTIREELTDDGIHPNVLGYEVMAQTLVKTLAANGINLAVT